MSTTEKLIKISFLIRKRDDITTEEFHRYWSEEHPKAWLSVAIVKAKIVKYSQFHFNNSLIDASMGLSMTPYDGAASL
ncbi:hypothetical protein UCRPA7_7756 [Phaeoacremonium minimum UCRPA7]|uniref:EthD domain-containing protein n=1 Tax=Phaeoacremonium minimum (strain UCR-PA7) TaxID=1286976 RepID=R8BBS3_PHAM7|nr:hypothetical protein UCRPA7_7756 [Phaeoacremonium minimum UCRPA7]EON96751.1 hypothetical protein UCRPA7_7756 [Phaeoacremonium minimum UCRPA7]